MPWSKLFFEWYICKRTEKIVQDVDTHRDKVYSRWKDIRIENALVSTSKSLPFATMHNLSHFTMNVQEAFTCKSLLIYVQGSLIFYSS